MDKKILYNSFVGKKFGKWKLLKYEGFISSSNPKYIGFKTHYFKCICQCGKIRSIPFNNLTAGCSKGCQKCARTTHGKSRTYLYSVWQKIINKHKKKNIKINNRWFDINKFIYDVNKHLGPRPSKKHMFLLKDIEKGYYINNIIWNVNSKFFI